jgi:hypothetical protein
MNAIKNFLKPTKVTWWVFGVLATVFFVAPVTLRYLIGNVAWLGAFVIPYILMLTLGMILSYLLSDFWGDVLARVVSFVLLWLLSCTISKIWYALKNKRNDIGLVS